MTAKNKRIPKTTTDASKDRGSLKLPEDIDLELWRLQVAIREEEGASASKRPSVIRRLLKYYEERQKLTSENEHLRHIVAYLEKGQTPPISTVENAEFFREFVRRCSTTNLLGQLGEILGEILRGEVRFDERRFDFQTPAAGVAATDPDLSQMSTPELVQFAKRTAQETEKLARESSRIASDTLRLTDEVEGSTETSKSDPHTGKRRDKIA
jgi:hypothetical protein